MKRQHIKKTMSMIEHFKCILDVIIDESNELISDSMENEGKPILITKKKNSFLIRQPWSIQKKNFRKMKQ